IAVHYAQGVVHFLHVQPGNGAPGAADRVEGPIVPVPQPANPLDLLVDQVDGPVNAAAGGVNQAQTAERQRGRLSQGVDLNIDELEAAAAEIAGHAVGGAEAHHDSLCGQRGFAFAGEHLDRAPQYRLAAYDEIGAVGGLAAGGGGDGAHILDAQNAVNGAKPRQGCQGALDALGAEAAGRGNLSAEAAQHLFIKNRRRASHRPFIDDKPYRIGADIDDADGFKLTPAPKIGVVARHALAPFTSSFLLGNAEPAR